MNKPRLLLCAVAGMALAVGVGIQAVDAWQASDQPPDYLETPSEKLNREFQEFESAIVPWFQLNNASLDEAAELLNQSAASLQAAPRQIRFVVWKEREPVPPGLELRASRNVQKLSPERRISPMSGSPPAPASPLAMPAPPAPLDVGSNFDSSSHVLVIPGLEVDSAGVAQSSETPQSEETLAPPMPPAGSGTLTVSLKNIPLLEAARYIGGMAGRAIHHDSDTVFFYSAEVLTPGIFRREFYLLASREYCSQVFGVPIGCSDPMFDLQPLLTAQGVRFKPGCSGFYYPASNMIAVELDAEEVDLVEALLAGGGCSGPDTAPTRLGRVKMQARYWWWGVTENLSARFAPVSGVAP